jgi:RNA polymerase sigma factor (sigma-70 family)
MMAETDADLVRRSRGGDAGAFALLARRHGKYVRAVARSVCGDPVEAQDLAQEAFLRAWTNLDFLADDARFRAWLGRIAFAVAIDHLRRWRAPATGDEALAALADPAADPEHEAAARELGGAVAAAITRLPAHYRRPLVMYHLEGLRHERIGDALGVGASTVRSLVTRARRALAHLMATEEALTMMTDDLLPPGPTPRRIHHVVNGDSTRMSLERSGVPGTMSVQADPLVGGPCPPVDGPAWWELRARHLAGHEFPVEAVRADLERWDRALATAADHDEVILWFEHDLICQLLLVRVLAHFHRQPPAPARLTLVCIGEHPAVPGFKGLGELTPDQLASLYETRAPVTAAMLALGEAAWAAYRDPDPRALERVLESDLTPLPFLGRALRRHLEEYPWVGDGLTRTQRELLRLVAQGIVEPIRIWQALHRGEDCHYVTDASFLEIVRALMAAALLESDAPVQLSAAGRPMRLTELGEEVLAGRRAVAPVGRWLGGVHLGEPPGWRWDPAAGRLVTR